MTEFAELGAHCERKDCHKLDFLPFQCNHCHHTYCLDHHAPDTHDCTVDITKTNVMPKCPICNAFIQIALNEAPDRKLGEHIDSGCTKHLFVDAEKQRKQERSAKLHCDAPTGCKNPNSYATIICKGCSHQFCLSHRAAEDHKCAHPIDPKKQSHAPTARSSLLDRFASKPKADTKSDTKTDKPTAATTSTSSSAVAGGSGSGTSSSSVAAGGAVIAKPAAAVAVAVAPNASLEKERKDREREHKKVQQQLTVERLKLRSKAVGDGSVPESRRVFFNIRYPSNSIDGSAVPARVKKSSPNAMFFDSNWSVGKVLDCITKASDVDNRNNNAKEKRLEVFGARTQAMFPSDISLSLLEPDLISGDTLELRYV